MKEYFYPSTNRFLFIAQENSAGTSWVAYLFKATDTPPTKAFSLDDAWNLYSGSYIFSAQTPRLSLDDLVKQIGSYINNTYNFGNPFNGRVMLWLLNSAANAFDNKNTASFKFGITFGNTVTTGSDLNLRVTQDLTFSITNGCVIQQSGDKLVFGTFSSSYVSLSSQNFRLQGNVNPSMATLSFNGNVRGCYQYSAYFQTQADSSGQCDFDYINFQLSYFYGAQQLLSQDYPIIKPTGNSQSVGFIASIDPTDILNKINPLRTWFAFTGKNADNTKTSLDSWLLTDTSYQINLDPQQGIDPFTGQPLSSTATMIFYNHQKFTDPDTADYYLAPSGAYLLTIPNVRTKQNLLCGISGTEIISFQPWDGAKGDTIVFTPGCAAFSPVFPMKDVSLYDTSDDTEKPLLDDTVLQTSWVSIVTPPHVPLQPMPSYSTQPKGASLYDKDKLINDKFKDFLGGFSIPVTISNSASLAYPLVPYAGITISPGNFNVVGFESQIINPFRKNKILNAEPKVVDNLIVATSDTKKATTPQGLIASVDTTSGRWTELLIASNFQPTKLDLKFTALSNTLYQAFQVNQQFLVITENKYLGTFYNKMNIESWPFQINTGSKKQFGDYSNVIIFKFCDGTLEDRAKNPQNWTMAKDFNAADETPDAAQLELTAISQWIQDYISDAKSQLTVHKNQFFQNFVNIVTDPTWNGVLTLKTDINLQTFPPELQGLIGGIDISRFNAHHFGVRTNPINAQDVGLSSTSSMFGLINYYDRAYEAQLQQGADPNKPVPALQGVDYDFKVLKLQVLFENAAVKDFSSKAQLTMNTLFSDTVVGVKNKDGVNQTNTIVYNGSYQKQGDSKPVYIFDQVGSNQFLFDSNVLQYTEIIKSQFNTIVNQGTTNSTLVRSRFSFWGYLSFGKQTYTDGNDTVTLDVFSFGSEKTTDMQVGLNMSNLAIEMDFDITTPTARNFTFDTSHVAFDIKQSRIRQDSLYPNFALQLNGLVTGTKDKKPSSLGYLEASTRLSTSFPDGNWYGLDCSLNLGTPGALASAAGFTSNLLFAWTPGSKKTDSTYNMMVGLKLPGTGGDAKLLSLQGVIKVSIGDINLLYSPKQNSYLLKLVDIGIKFLGIAKLPPGATISFYLFGNPTQGASKEALGWYAAYVKEEKKTSSNGSETEKKQHLRKGTTTVIEKKTVDKKNTAATDLQSVTKTKKTSPKKKATTQLNNNTKRTQ